MTTKNKFGFEAPSEVNLTGFEPSFVACDVEVAREDFRAFETPPRKSGFTVNMAVDVRAYLDANPADQLTLYVDYKGIYAISLMRTGTRVVKDPS